VGCRARGLRWLGFAPVSRCVGWMGVRGGVVFVRVCGFWDFWLSVTNKIYLLFDNMISV